jgi:hypothetical protein
MPFAMFLWEVCAEAEEIFEHEHVTYHNQMAALR